jgi:hypothetical protein
MKRFGVALLVAFVWLQSQAVAQTSTPYVIEGPTIVQNGCGIARPSCWSISYPQDSQFSKTDI